MPTVLHVIKTVSRWYNQFNKNGHIDRGKHPNRQSHSTELVAYVCNYVTEHPCFYVEELQEELKHCIGHNVKGISATSLLRLLRFELGLSRKVLERAREAVPRAKRGKR
ncbi:hypothetical protein PHMEG_00017881 [Phytophthora megakarya]|uniref:Uncharacterized protein n=1 Tax=Phytophthora megakarya TaxID=4795 RepID=A0A225VXX5_9STRA|nr:hypothetical protein PHMEG_00017881 [Phytophthora megakarya]